MFRLRSTQASGVFMSRVPPVGVASPTAARSGRETRPSKRDKTGDIKKRQDRGVGGEGKMVGFLNRIWYGVTAKSGYI
jgi:hypothetical protein